ncbi:MAG: hypothetical protein QXP97_07105 [Desulfurococcus sp.]|jgi:division protein CdvB (Snf7/Vps24/ESCRT-III family)|uniref:hypothetical protein n=1 Tax=Desulfurococcus sp. TaxID=51678 RepID=UPI003165D08E
MFRRSRDPLRKALETLYHVRLLRNKIDILYNRVSERRDVLFEKLTDLESKGEKYLAKRYAEEIAKLDKLLARLAAVQLILEKIDLALQYAINMREFSGLASEINNLVKDMSKIPELNIPDLNLVFIELQASARELSEASEANSVVDINYSIPEGSDVKRILEEAKEVMKKKLENELTV